MDPINFDLLLKFCLTSHHDGFIRSQSSRYALIFDAGYQSLYDIFQRVL